MNPIVKRIIDLSKFDMSSSTYIVPQELAKLAAHVYANYLLYDENEGIMFDEDDPHQNPFIVSDKSLRFDNDDACLFLTFVNNELYDKCNNEEIKSSDFIVKYINDEIRCVYGFKQIKSEEDDSIAFDPVLNIMEGFDSDLFTIFDNTDSLKQNKLESDEALNMMSEGVANLEQDDELVKEALQRDIIKFESESESTSKRIEVGGPIIVDEIKSSVESNVIVSALNNLKEGIIPEYNNWENKDTFNWYVTNDTNGDMIISIYSGVLLRHLICSKALEFIKEKKYDDTMMLLDATTLSISDKLLFKTYSSSILKVLPLSFKKMLEEITGKKYKELSKLFYENEVDIPLVIKGDKLDFVINKK